MLLCINYVIYIHRKKSEQKMEKQNKKAPVSSLL